MKKVIIKCPNRDCGATLTVDEKDCKNEMNCPVCSETTVFKLTNIDPVLNHRPLKKYYKPPVKWN